jgi:transitional endoplasmic reticulum ATPase
VSCCLVGTSNRASDIDPSLRRGGRLEHEIAVSNTPEDRRALLVNLLQSHLTPLLSASSGAMRGEQAELDDVIATVADRVALQTGGYVAADLSALVAAAKTDFETTAQLALDDAVRTLQSVLMDSFHRAAKLVGPSCLRGASVTLPSLTYGDIIGYASVKRSLQRVLSFARPELQHLAARFGLHASPGGVLLHGPPGNSKTRLASAAAAHHGLPMISLSAADIYSPYVGDAEAEVRRAFQLARQAAPCVLFIDELDSIVTNRDTGGTGGGSSSASVEGRVLATLLTEMDGMQNTVKADSGGGKAGARNSSGGVIVLGATNRLDFIDAALIRKVRCGTLRLLDVFANLMHTC